jgi:voltage-gated potassium channel
MTGDSALRRAAVALVAVLVAGAVGYRLLGFGWLDAVYQTVTTVTTVGFREVEPLNRKGKVFTIVLIFLGVGTALFTLSLLMQAIAEGHFQRFLGRRRMDRTIAKLSDHAIVCGWGRVGRAIAHDLAAAGRPCVVVDLNAEGLAGIAHPFVVGDATDDDVLAQAGIDRASALVAAISTDAENLFVTLSGRERRPDLFIVARARDEGSAPKLLRAGANRVVNPQEIGGARMAAFLLRPHVAEFLDVVMHDQALEFRLEEIPIPADSPLTDITIGDAAIRRRTGALVLALRQDGRFILNPEPSTQLQVGQILIVIGTETELKALTTLAAV